MTRERNSSSDKKKHDAVSYDQAVEDLHFWLETLFEVRRKQVEKCVRHASKSRLAAATSDDKFYSSLSTLYEHLVIRAADVFKRAEDDEQRANIYKDFILAAIHYTALFVVIRTPHDAICKILEERAFTDKQVLTEFYRYKNSDSLLDLDNWFYFYPKIQNQLLDELSAEDESIQAFLQLKTRGVRVRKEVSDRFYDLDILNKIFPQYIKFLTKEGRLRTEKTRKDKSETQSLFPSIPGLEWKELTITFVLPDTIRVQARHISRNYSYDEIGFGDKRQKRYSKPNTCWTFLKTLALQSGGIMLPSKQKLKQHELMTHIVTDLRKILRTLVPIEDDPFYPYAKSNAYVQKFNLNDNTPTEDTEQDEPLNYYSRKDYESDARIQPKYRRDDISEDKQHDEDYD